ncbi:MAG TPA: DinB family protein [Actinophytocola sp.]|uniref:DinB family protein n=1 Tax=Actinophytocola sp. TaxID=1872138 RepID=UPI002DDD72EF|nr:DinB family protein [Actinophytocola sp.]HEV2783212.1 DinB family protein [Actinophytocola sp.]
MTPLPESSYSPRWQAGARTDPPPIADEREMLISYLEYYRRTVELKCLGVPKERFSDRTMPPSTMTLHGLVRHLAGVEQWWFHHQFAREKVDFVWGDDAEDDFDDLSGDAEEALATWRAMCERSREIVAGSRLDDTGVRERNGEPFSLRWVLLRMITEYARHCGHADLLREGIDGATGE